jgi:hypothetical protein
MIYKRSLRPIIVVTLLLMYSVPSSAQFLYQPRVMIGYMDYEMSVDAAPQFSQVLGSRILASEILGDGDSEAGSATDISDSFMTLGVGLSIIKGQWFGDIYIQDSLSGGFEDSNDFAFEVPNRIPNATQISDGDLDRRDFAISVGKSFKKGFSVSAGYKAGVTAFDQIATINGESFFTDYEFDIAGPFAAISYGKRIGNGVLGVNFAVAALSADYDFGTSFFQFDPAVLAAANSPASQREGIVGNIDGSATGVTFGVNWKAPLPLFKDEDLTYAVSIDSYNYDIDLSGDAPLIQPDALNQNRIVSLSTSNLQADFAESVVSLRLAIQYLF